MLETWSINDVVQRTFSISGAEMLRTTTKALDVSSVWSKPQKVSSDWSSVIEACAHDSYEALKPYEASLLFIAQSPYATSLWMSEYGIKDESIEVHTGEDPKSMWLPGKGLVTARETEMGSSVHHDAACSWVSKRDEEIREEIDREIENDLRHRM
jgi:hypothetical protein